MKITASNLIYCCLYIGQYEFLYFSSTVYTTFTDNILIITDRNEYQESSWGKERPVRKAENLTAICEPFV
jgi:hypothetical protein